MDENVEFVEVNCPVCGCESSRLERVLDGYKLTRCSRCSMVFANPRFSAETLLAGYDDQGEQADAIHRTEDLAGYYALRTTDENIAHFDRVLADFRALKPQGGRLLDFGCGAGYFVQRAGHHRIWDVHGVEVGTWARAEADRRGIANVHIGLLQDQGFESESFDVVHSSQVLEHLDSPLGELAEIRRVLKPGGIFYGNVPNYGSLSIRLGRDHFESNRPMGHLSYFTHKTLTRLMTEAGFETLRTATYGGLNWENILGRGIDYPHDRIEATEEGPIRDPFASIPMPGQGEILPQKGAARRFAEALLYRRAKFGIELEIFARKI